MRIKAGFDLLEIEISSQHKMLFSHSFEIKEQCLEHFDKIGIMDLQGDGALIRESRKGANKQFSSQIDLKSKKSINIGGNQEVVAPDFKIDVNKKEGGASNDLHGKFCELEVNAKTLCKNVNEINKLHLAINTYYDNVETFESMLFPSIKPTKENQNPIYAVILE